MFRKIVSNLAFSPSLVGQLSFYAKRLRKEEFTRRLGLIFTALALVVQSLVVFSPPEAANAASSADMIRGGVPDKAGFLAHYDKNTNHIKDLFNNLGITRAEIANTKRGKIKKNEVAGKYNWSLTSLYSPAQGEKAYSFDGLTFYNRPLRLTAGNPPYNVIEGNSKKFGWFAIKLDCGNLITKKQPKPPKKLNPAVACEKLAISRLSPIKIRLEARASKKDGANIRGYEFTIRSAKTGKVTKKTIQTSKTSSSYDYTQKDPATYRASVTVLSSLGQKTSPDCSKEFKIIKAALCKNLTVQKINDTTFKIASVADVKAGAKINRYIYSIKDGSGKVLATRSFNHTKEKHSFEYKQSTPGSYKVTLLVKTSIGDVSNKNCIGEFTVPKKEDPPTPEPVTECVSLSAKVNKRTVTLNANALAEHGGAISSYTFTVKDKAGKVVKQVKVASKSLSASAPAFDLAPGDYTAQVTVATSLGNRTGPACTTVISIVGDPTAPITYCTSLSAEIVGSNSVSLEAEARAQGGAKIISYTFVVKDKNGKVVKQEKVNQTGTSATAPTIELKPGEYTTQVTVATSMGDRTSAACATKFSIPQPGVCPYNNQLPVDHPDCQPCPDDPKLWIKDPKCSAELISTKTAANLTHGNDDASKTLARAGDKISYTVTVENVGLAEDKAVMTESLNDVLQYARLIDYGGGKYDENTKKLSWGEVVVGAGQKESRTFVVQVLDPIPSTNMGTSDQSSYDCVMTNTFGNSVDIKVDCPVVKQVVESTVSELPHTGPTENMIFGGALLAVVVFFYARARQLGTEVRLVRRDVHAGAI
ncbi:hypothetical protein H6796_00985 [Candidatus Nomurabacteria bacterium]|nr:hypothetical protein [Candidatus Nomurabacteria bacterium]